MSDFVNHQYKNMQSRWQMCRDAAAGEYEVHNKGKTYLPALGQESETDYDARLKMTPFFGATWRTIITLRGMMFRKPPEITAPDSFKLLLSNIDNADKSFTSFAQDVSLEALTVGRAGILTEYSQVPNGITQADAFNAGFRSFLTRYTAESILDWHHVNMSGSKLLSYVRLLEDAADYPEIELGRHDEIHRVLQLTDSGYIQQIFVNDGKDDKQIGADIIPRMGGSTMNFIPFQPIGVDALSIDVEIPPLIDLVSMNFHHYRQSSAYERGCFISGLPTLFVYGNNDEEKKIYIGGSMANSFPDPQARAEFVEVKSNFTALLENLSRKEHQMAVLGARMLESQKAGVESAEAWERKQSGEESILADISVTVGSGLAQSLKWMGEWEGVNPDEINVSLNKEFLPFAMSAQEITAMMQAYLQRGMSYTTLYHNFKRAGLYPSDTTMEDEKNMIDEGIPGMI